MRLLVVGIDGADAENIRHLPMPFMHQLLNTSAQPLLTEDLWSRGWAEIISGAHGRETGAFYHRPKQFGTYAFTQTYRRDDFQYSRAAKPLWQ
ncbi:MAG: hypothetical protein WDA11_09950, partial [Thiohalomonadaceae bacterium]